MIREGGEEGAWAEGTEIKLGKNWAMYFEYQFPCSTVQEIIYIHDLAGEKLEEIVEGFSSIDIDGILTELGNYLEDFD